LTIFKTYDNLSRLLRVTNAPVADAAVNFRYAYRGANQRTALTNTDSSRWAFGYDMIAWTTDCPSQMGD
jgi:hypothetical protein